MTEFCKRRLNRDLLVVFIVFSCLGLSSRKLSIVYFPVLFIFIITSDVTGCQDRLRTDLNCVGCSVVKLY